MQFTELTVAKVGQNVVELSFGAANTVPVSYHGCSHHTAPQARTPRDFWPRNVVKCGICYGKVHPSACHTRSSGLNGSRYRNMLAP